MLCGRPPSCAHHTREEFGPHRASERTHSAARTASRRAPGIDGVPSLEEALRRLEQEDDVHNDGLPRSLPSDCCSDLDNDPLIHKV